MGRPEPTGFPAFQVYNLGVSGTQAKVEPPSQLKYHLRLNSAVSNVYGLDLGGWLEAAEQTFLRSVWYCCPPGCLGGDSHLADFHVPSFLLCREACFVRDVPSGIPLQATFQPTAKSGCESIAVRRRVFFAARRG